MTEAPQPSVQPVIRMDRSRAHGTVHGERVAGDPHAGVHFYQDGLPFNAQGELVADHPDITGDPAKQMKVERLQAKALKLLAKLKERASDEDEEDDEDDEDKDQAPINLEAWARGEQELEWQMVTNAIAQRFGVRVKDKRGAVERLIEERVVAPADLSPKHRKLIQD
jgi:hypothetical protein